MDIQQHSQFPCEPSESLSRNAAATGGLRPRYTTEFHGALPSGRLEANSPPYFESRCALGAIYSSHRGQRQDRQHAARHRSCAYRWWAILVEQFVEECGTEIRIR